MEDMERLFLGTEHRIISTFPVIKCNPSSHSRGTVQPPVPTDAARIVCITLERRTRSMGFKPSMHVCKARHGQYEVRKTYRLKLVSRLEAFSRPNVPQALLELTMAQSAFTGGDIRLAFQAVDDDERVKLLGTIYSFCLSHENRRPLLVGISEAQLGAYADVEDAAAEGFEFSGGKSASTATTPEKNASSSGQGEVLKGESLQEIDPQAMVLRHQPLQKKKGRRLSFALSGEDSLGKDINASATETFVDGKNSYKEAYNGSQQSGAQLAGLLDVVAGGTASLEDVRTRLMAELAALQGASVHELLECSRNGGILEEELSTSLAFACDVEDMLGVFEAKLKNMREHMAAVESYTTRIEARSRGNASMVEALEQVVSALSMDPAAEVTLKSRWELTPDGPAVAAAAGRTLHRTLNGASTWAEGVSSGLQNMTAVTTQRRHLQNLSTDFLFRSTDFLEQTYIHIADDIVAALASRPSGDRIKPPPHGAMHARARRVQPLLQTVIGMRPAAAEPLRKHYFKAVNTLLRKEIDVATKELLRQSVVGSTGGTELGAEPDLTTKKANSMRTLEIMYSSPRRGSSSQIPRKDDESAGGSGSGPPEVGRQQRQRRDNRQRLSGSGKDIGIPIEESFSQLLSTYVPVLMDAVSVGIEVLCCTGLGENTNGNDASKVAFELLDTLPQTILSFLDPLKPPKVLPAISMMGTTLMWQAKVRSHIGGGWAIADVLRQFENRLRSLWENYTDDSVASIQKYDGSALLAGQSTRGVHVLPFIVNFQGVSSRIETILADWVAKESSFSPPPSRAQEQEAREQRGSPFESQEPKPHQSTTNPSIMGAEPIQHHQDNQFHDHRHVSKELRGMADALYGRVLPHMLVAVEAHADMDQKNGPRVRLENYAFLRIVLQDPALARVPMLKRWCADIGGRRNGAVAAYVERQVAALKIDGLLQLGAQMGELAASGLSPAETATRVRWSSGDVSAAMHAVATTISKSLTGVRAKLQRQLSESSPYLVDIVWERLEARCLQTWAELEQRLPACFPDVTVTMTTDGLRAAFAAAKAAGP